MLLERRLDEGSRSPHIRGEESVRRTKSIVARLDGVTLGTGVTLGAREDISDTSEGHHLLSRRGTDNTGTTWSWDETHGDRTTLTGALHRDGVWGSELGTPITTADRDQVDLGVEDSTTDGCGDLLAGLPAKTDVTVTVTNSDEALEASALTGGGLLLDRGDPHDIILERDLTFTFTEHMINDLVLLDRERVEVDVFDLLDAALLHEASELGHWGPLFTTLTLTLAFTLALALTLALTVLTLALTESTFETSLTLAFSLNLTSVHRELLL